MLELLFASTVLIICDFYSNDLNNNITHATTHPTPKLFEFIMTVEPAPVIIETGSNYVNIPNHEFIKTDSKNMVLEIKNGGATCFWVSAPDMRMYRNELPRLDKLIQDSIGDDYQVFDSKTATSYPAKGGEAFIIGPDKERLSPITGPTMS